MQVLQAKQHLQRATRFRKLWATYQQNKDLVQVGAYEMGSNTDLDYALHIKENMLGFLIQDMNEPCELDQSIQALEGLIDGD